MPATRIEPKKKRPLFEWKEILEYRDLLYFLALRDIQLRYKQTALGILWVVLQPLVPAIIFAILFGNFAKMPSNGQPYLLLVFCGLIPWNIFNGALGLAGDSLVGSFSILVTPESRSA
jgi:lipopolysaccharide transport system permease protein